MELEKSCVCIRQSGSKHVTSRGPNLLCRKSFNNLRISYNGVSVIVSEPMWLYVRKQKKQPTIMLPQPAKGMACAASPGQVSSGAGDGKPPPEEQSKEFSIRNWGKRTKAKVCLLHCVFFIFFFMLKYGRGRSSVGSAHL